MQRRASKLVKGIKNLPYEKRLDILDKKKLELERERADLIEYLKISNGLSLIDWHNPNKLARSLDSDGPAGNIRGFKHRLTKQFMKCIQRDHLPKR